jgi:hypothetical protein
MKQVIIILICLLFSCVSLAQEKPQAIKVPQIQVLAIDQTTGTIVLCIDGYLVIGVYQFGLIQLEENKDGKIIKKKCEGDTI